MDIFDNDDENIALQSVLVTNRNGGGIQQKITSAELMKSIHQSMNVNTAYTPTGHEKEGIDVNGVNDTDEESETEEEVVKIREDFDRPLNEFTENEVVLYGAFPTLFPFGRGLKGRILNVKYRNW